MVAPSSPHEVSTWLLAAGFLYLVAVTVIAFISRRQAAGEAGFYLAGRTLGPLAATSTIAATAIGSSSTILLVGLIYSRGLSAIWIELAGGAGLIILGLFFARRVRSMRLFTLPEIAGEFYGGGIRFTAACLVVVAETGWLAMLLKASQVLLQPVIAVPPQVIIAAVGFAFVFYTLVGGQLAVARTDILQLVLMGVIALAALATLTLAGGEFWSHAESGNLHTAEEGFPAEELIPLALVYGLSHVVGSDIYGKLLSARGGEVARRAAVGAGWIKIGFALAVASIGLAALAVLPAGVPPGEALSRLARDFLPSPVAALALLALLAALMSSADSVLLTAGTVLGRDLLGKSGPVAGRLAIAAIGIVGIALAGFFATLLDAFRFAYTLFSAALTLPILLGFWRHRLRISTLGAGAAMAGGAITVVVSTLMGLPAAWVPGVGLGTCCALLFAVSFFKPSPTRNQ